MTRDEVERLLRFRFQLTEVSFSDDTVAAWHRLLADFAYAACRDRMQTLVSEGAKDVRIGDITGELKSQFRYRSPQIECDHGSTWVGDHCDRCGEELLRGDDHRAIAAMGRGLAQAAAEIAALPPEAQERRRRWLASIGKTDTIGATL